MARKRIAHKVRMLTRRRRAAAARAVVDTASMYDAAMADCRESKHPWIEYTQGSVWCPTCGAHEPSYISIPEERASEDGDSESGLKEDSDLYVEEDTEGYGVIFSERHSWGAHYIHRYQRKIRFCIEDFKNGPWSDGLLLPHLMLVSRRRALQWPLRGCGIV